MQIRRAWVALVRWADGSEDWPKYNARYLQRSFEHLDSRSESEIHYVTTPADRQPSLAVTQAPRGYSQRQSSQVSGTPSTTDRGAEMLMTSVTRRVVVALAVSQPVGYWRLLHPDRSQQVRRRDRGTRGAEHADLKGQEQDRARDTGRAGHYRDDEGRHEGDDLCPASTEHSGNLLKHSGKARHMTG